MNPLARLRVIGEKFAERDERRPPLKQRESRVMLAFELALAHGEAFAHEEKGDALLRVALQRC